MNRRGICKNVRWREQRMPERLASWFHILNDKEFAPNTTAGELLSIIVLSDTASC